MLIIFKTPSPLIFKIEPILNLIPAPSFDPLSFIVDSPTGINFILASLLITNGPLSELELSIETEFNVICAVIFPTSITHSEHEPVNEYSAPSNIKDITLSAMV